jgi:hypothetical protein
MTSHPSHLSLLRSSSRPVRRRRRLGIPALALARTAASALAWARMAPALALARIAAFFLVLNRVIAAALTIGCAAACAHAPPISASAPATEPEPALPQTPDLTPDKLGRLFDCVAALQRQQPASLYWVSPLEGTDGLFVTTQFHYSFTRKYSGHEVAIFSRDRAAYYWMPGAQHDATGFVPMGHYRVDAELPDHSRALRLTFEKRSPTAFVLLQQGSDDATATAPVKRILPRPLPVEIIQEDLHEMAFFALTFYAQALRADALRDALLPAVTPGSFTPCRKLTQRLDTALAGVDDALAGADTKHAASASSSGVSHDASSESSTDASDGTNGHVSAQ